MLCYCRISLSSPCKAVLPASRIGYEVIRVSNQGGKMDMEWGEQGQTGTCEDNLECMKMKENHQRPIWKLQRANKLMKTNWNHEDTLGPVTLFHHYELQ